MHGGVEWVEIPTDRPCRGIPTGHSLILGEGQQERNPNYAGILGVKHPGAILLTELITRHVEILAGLTI
jgi:hypothetical protein